MALFRRKPPPERPAPEPSAVVLGYHQRSSHAQGRYARALGFLDWDNQPSPFRRFEGAPLVEMPRPAPLDAAYGQAFNPGARPAAELDATSLSSFLYHALALSAWKSIPEARWSLRVNPSSGNLHPTEGWLLLPALDGLHTGPALWHYAPKEHGLERRADWDAAAFDALAGWLPAGGFGVALSSIPWREAWKYGERAFRYCQHDVGHALGALSLSATLHGWTLVTSRSVGDEALARLLGTDRPDGGHEHEEEEPDLLAWVVPAGASVVEPGDLHEQVEALARSARFAGTANALSPEHHPWDVIAVVAQASRRKRGEPDTISVAWVPSELPWMALPAMDASTVIRGRRSAVSMDGRTSMSRAHFFGLLGRCVPALSPTPHQSLPDPVRVHLALFVHRVDDLPPGVYLLLRHPDGEALLRPRLRKEFGWEVPDGCPPELPLRRLHTSDVRRTAANLCCGQDIAADGCFAVAMLADLGGALEHTGAAAYRSLHWETGLVGQVLYLEAQARGVAATGIGCFFDDDTHATLGLTDGRVRTLYHFTVGGAVTDERLTTEPAYGWEATRG